VHRRSGQQLRRRALSHATDPAHPAPAGSELAIIIPVLNEAATLPALLERLQQLRCARSEIIVVDGGSTDDTVALAQQQGLQVICTSAGRARQMNAGAAASRAGALLFLHADTTLPAAAEHIVLAALQSGQGVWGRFDVRIAGRSPMLRVIAFTMNLRSAVTGIATGDQSLFMTREAFDSVGGFPDQALMEDVEMSRRLRQRSPPIRIKTRAVTSGRRWETHGVWRTMVLMWQLRWAYWRGVPAEQLARRYR
jgi:rSAM/selenodomain-associated transferase 2